MNSICLYRWTIILLLAANAVAAAAQSTVNIKDWFPLVLNSEWKYTGKNQSGSSPDDDFRWFTRADKKTITTTLGTIQAWKIETDAEENDDAREGNIDYWYVHTDNRLYFCGMFFAQGSTGVPPQDIICNDPLLIGGNNQAIGSVVNDTATATMSTALGNVTVTLTSKITYAEIVPRVLTPMGYFNNVLRLVFEIEANGPFGFSEDLNTSEIFLKQGRGMIKQDQDSDPDDAEIQAIYGLKINNVVLGPDVKNAALYWSLYE
jgi:hypothetical protein